MPPVISNFTISRVTDTIVRASFDSSEPLDTITIEFGGISSPPPSLNEGDLTLNSGTYSGTIDLAEGSYLAELVEASNAGGDGASGQSYPFDIPWVAQNVSVFTDQNDAPIPIIIENNPVEFTQFSDIDLMTRRTLGNPLVSGPVTFAFGQIAPNQEIRYTVNGRNPNSKSKLYTGPFTVSQNLSGSDNSVIKARIFDKNNPSLRSKIMRASFRL